MAICTVRGTTQVATSLGWSAPTLHTVYMIGVWADLHTEGN